MQRLLLLLKFIVMPMAHIALMLKAGFRAYEYALTPDAINLQFPSHPTEVCSLLGCCSLENRTGLQSGPSLSFSN